MPLRTVRRMRSRSSGFSRKSYAPLRRRLDRRLDRAVARDHDDGQVGDEPEHFVEGFEAIHPGHLHVHEDEINTALTDAFDGLRSIPRYGDLITLVLENPR